MPFPLHVEHSRGEGVTICMTKVEGGLRAYIEEASKHLLQEIVAEGPPGPRVHFQPFVALWIWR